MINTKETLKKLHKKFPLMSLDELFEIVDCYVEEVITSGYYRGWDGTVTSTSVGKEY